MLFFQYIMRLPLAALSNFVDLFETLFRVPFKAFSDWKAGDDEFSEPDERPDEANGSVGQKLAFVALLPLKALWWLIALPFRLYTETDSQRKLDLLSGLPALITVGVVLLFLVRSYAMSSGIAEEYRKRAISSMRSKDFSKANFYFTRIVNDSRLSATEADRLNWAVSLSGDGQDSRAKALLNELAPDDQQGFEPAHRLKAVGLVKSLEARKQNTDYLEQLHFQLKCSGETKSPEINEAWAVYYISIGQLKDAVNHLKVAALKNPSHYVTIADLNKRMGKKDEVETNLNLAVQTIVSRLEDNPLDHSTRIQLAKAYAEQNKYDDATEVLERGFDLKPDREIRIALADFHASRFDNQQELDFATRFGFLAKSLHYDINFLPSYERLIAFCMQSKANQERDTIKKYLVESLAEGRAAALCHFALSNIELYEGDQKQAEWHIDKAFELNNNLPSIANNLAWMLAHSNEPNIPRALELAEDVVARNPTDVQFRDTLAHILSLAEDYERAAFEFEKVLSMSSGENHVHRKLAEIYRKLGQVEIALQHEKLAR